MSTTSRGGEEIDYGPPRYFVPICIQHEHGFFGGPMGYLEMPRDWALAWSTIEIPSSVRLMDKLQEILRRTLPMFSVRQKREISGAVQKILRETNHPELPEGEIKFHLHIPGEEEWSWANITHNGAVSSPSVNPHNEAQDPENNPGRPG